MTVYEYEMGNNEFCEGECAKVVSIVICLLM